MEDVSNGLVDCPPRRVLEQVVLCLALKLTCPTCRAEWNVGALVSASGGLVPGTQVRDVRDGGAEPVQVYFRQVGPVVCHARGWERGEVAGAAVVV